jgi:hypothetical protein
VSFAELSCVKRAPPGRRVAAWTALAPAFGAAALLAIPLASASSEPAAELAHRYAPVVRLVRQATRCGHGEPFEPTNVNLVLGNPDVALHGPWNRTNIVKVGPTAHDLSKGLFAYHLDFPGNPLTPACTYDQWSHQLNAGSRPTVFARVVTDRRHPDQLALQYWFFYVFNDFNDKHEGDWEMIQLNFDAPTAAAALAKRPSLVGYSQHAGAESAKWGDKKLELVDRTRPVVYPALGSHANYYGSNLYLGRSAAEGVGCDNTVGPSRELRPLVVLIPTDRQAYLRTFPWLGYAGHWGEERTGFYDGPTGPNTKQQWAEPISWADASWRDRSFAVPEGSVFGSTATDFFCGAVAFGSGLLTAAVGNPSPLLIAVAVLAIVLLWLTSRTRWDLSAPFPVRRRRPWGSIVTAARRQYIGHVRLFLGIGLLFVPLGLIITTVQYLLFRVGVLAPLVQSAGASNGVVGSLALALGVLITLIGLAIVHTTTALAMVELDAGREVRVVAAFRQAVGLLPTVIGGLVVAALVVAVVSLTTIGVLIAVFLVVRWGLIAQVVAVERQNVLGSMRRSAQLVRGSWWRAASLTLFITVFALLLGPTAGAVLLFATSASFDFVNLIASLVFVFTLPYVAIATTYLYFDLAAREEESETADATAPAARGA